MYFSGNKNDKAGALSQKGEYIELANPEEQPPTY